MNSATIQTDRPRIYVACLAAYNAGQLHGAWIDATQGDWAIWQGIQTMLVASPVAGAEEYAINDYEGFGGVRISEHEGIATVAEIASFIVEHGALGVALLTYFGSDLAESRKALDERYLGSHESLADYVQEVTEECIAVPDRLRAYVDWQAVARDAELSGDLFTVQTAWDVVHVFAGH